MRDLIELAAQARGAAYAPYSGYKVGAAIRGANGQVWTGCNVENISYGLCICAERGAVMQMVREGCHEIAEVAVVTRDGGTPCGACLQVLFEFAPAPEAVTVMTADEKGTTQRYTLAEMMPHGFRSAAVKRTE